jgi:hypothetical protein
MTEPPVLRSSWRGILKAVGGSLALCVAGAWGALTGGVHPVNVTVGVLGVILLGITLWDYPLTTQFASDGLHRRTPLRRVVIGWDVVDRFSRTAPRVRLVERSGRRRAGFRPGPLVAVVGRRRVLLCDRAEDPGLRIRLATAVAAVSPALADTLGLDR